MHTVTYVNNDISSGVKITSAATNDSFMMKPADLTSVDIINIEDYKNVKE